MYLSTRAWPMAVLMPTLAWALQANMKIWALDESCFSYSGSVWTDGKSWTYGIPPTTMKKKLSSGTDQTTYLQDNFNGALHFSVAAQDSLKFALGKRPDPNTQTTDWIKWVRIAESMAVTLGFSPDPDKEESKTDKNWAQAFEPFDTISSTLPAQENLPKSGFNPEIKGLPKIGCGERWQWLDLSADVPGKKGEPIKSTDLGEKIEKDKYAGIWWWDERVVFEETVAYQQANTEPVYCYGGTEGTTIREWNMIIFCDAHFTKRNKQFWENAALIKEGNSFEKVLATPEATVLHELFHWYGGAAGDDPYVAKIIDEQAVNENGWRVWLNRQRLMVTPKSKDSEKVMEDKGYTKVFAYDRKDVFNLAREHENPSEFSGPQKALYNAQSYTAFAIMMYYDEWSWASEGIAKKPRRP